MGSKGLHSYLMQLVALRIQRGHLPPPIDLNGTFAFVMRLATEIKDGLWEGFEGRICRKEIVGRTLSKLRVKGMGVTSPGLQLMTILPKACLALLPHFVAEEGLQNGGKKQLGFPKTCCISCNKQRVQPAAAWI